MLQIHEAGAGIGTTEGAMVVTFEGYIRGVPNFSPAMRLRLLGSKTENRPNPLSREFADALRVAECRKVLDHQHVRVS